LKFTSKLDAKKKKVENTEKEASAPKRNEKQESISA